MAALKTVNVLIVTIGSVIALATLTLAILIGNTKSAQEETKQVKACVAAGDQWVRADCVHTKP